MRSASSLPRRSSNKAAALIIVLAFVVLLTGLAVAYLSRATTDRQLAHTSFNDTDADALARSALDIVIGDFRQEIKQGSSLASGIYTPTSAANVVPMRNGDPAIPNLIRRSLRSETSLWPDPVAGPAVGSRASAANSTNPADVSANGRSVSLARWNSHYMVPKANTTDAGWDPITTGFAAPNYWAPDWVFVKAYDPVTTASPGPAVITAPDPLVVGRYAYAVYDEGGLLDANLMGLPSPSPGAVTIASPSPSRTVYPARKGSVAFADLTVLHLTSGGITPNPLTISKIVGWRNYATTTVDPGSSFPDLSPSPSPFVTYFLDNSRDFLTVNTVTNSGRTDQAFTTRAELIQLVLSLGDTNPNANITNLLQYLGTFSREQNSPTWLAASNPVSQRFQLDKISLLGSSPTPSPAPTSQTAADIKKYFGLQWSTTTQRWQYVGNQGTCTPGSCPLLSAIPAPTASPAPDFFQILSYAYSNPGPTPTIDKILSLGAAIIDQYDADQVTTGIDYAPAPAVAWGAEDPNNPGGVIPMGSPGPSPLPTPIAGYSPVLQRPFQNVGELGYVYNPITGNTLNFYASGSDAVLLDFFTYNTTGNPAPLRAGPVNVNTQNAAVIAAILTGALPNEPPTTAGVSASTATTAANLIAAATSAQPAGYDGGIPVGRKDLARLAAAVGTTIGSTEEQKETVARVLADTTQTRTWGLLIDVIAQTGRYPANVLQNPQHADLPKFVVEGEAHYWVHVAIDRFTGQVIDRKVEVVKE